MWKGEYHMKVRRVNDFSPTLVNLDFFQNGLTVWAVTVTAGIIVDFCMSAVCTFADGTAKSSTFAVHNGMSSFFLNAGKS